MKKRGQIKKRPGVKKGLRNSLAPRSGKPGTKIEKLLKEYGTDKIYNGRDKKGRLVENGKIVRCPVCGSSKIKRKMMFDYIKTCMNNKCSGYKKEGWRNNFNTGVHN